MSKRFKVLPLLFAAALSSCSVISFEELECACSVSERETHYGAEWIRLDFSIAMERRSVENLISLKEDGSAVESEIAWSGSACLFRAAGGFKKGERYSFSAAGTACAADGRSYALNLWREFIFGSESETFLLESAEEKADQKGDVEAIEFTFNKAVDPALFERNFYLSPYAETEKKYSDDFSRVQIVPQKKWRANIFYEWRIEGILSSDGVKINRPYSGSFLACKKEKAPELLLACPVAGETFLENMGLDDLFESQSIGLLFDCGMNFESVQNGVHFVPPVQGYWTQISEERFIFTPGKNYQTAGEYTLCVSDSVEDKWGIALSESKNIPFKQKTEFIEIERIAFDGEEIAGERENDAEIFEGAPVYIDIYFSRMLEEKSLESLKSAVKFEALLPGGAEHPRLNSIFVKSKNCASFCYSGLKKSSAESEAIYKLTVFGGQKFIYDAQGECLKEDACFYIKTR